MVMLVLLIFLLFLFFVHLRHPLIIGDGVAMAAVRLTDPTLPILPPYLAHYRPRHRADRFGALVQHAATVVGDGRAALPYLLQHVLADVVRFQLAGQLRLDAGRRRRILTRFAAVTRGAKVTAGRYTARQAGRVPFADAYERIVCVCVGGEEWGEVVHTYREEGRGGEFWR